jgi:RNA polymerase sigma-70 factor (sigma-E family)
MPSGTRQEFVEYASANLPRLHRTAYLLCGDPHRADDIVQSTLTSLFVHWKKAGAADNLDAYVHRIMVRRFLDELRRSWSKVLLWAEAPERATPEDETVENRDVVLAALRRLPKGQRAVLVLRYIADLSVEETAQALNCSTGNVKSQSARGLATLRAVMTDAEPVYGPDYGPAFGPGRI